MIALIAAVPLETELLRPFLPQQEELRGGLRLRCGDRGGQSLGLIHTGVGKANAAAASALLLSQKKIRAAILFGCGGAFPGVGLNVGDLALASAEIYGDEGALTPQGFLDMEGLGLPLHREVGERFFNRLPLDARLTAWALALLGGLAAKEGRRLAGGPFVTVSCCSGTEAAARQLAARTGGLCENMEGAAVVQTCRRFCVPVLEVRGISNLTLDRDPSQWDLPAAAAIAQRAVLRLLEDWAPPGGPW